MTRPAVESIARRLTVGRIVHYFTDDSAEAPPIAALCIAVSEADGRAELELFPPTSGAGRLIGTVSVGLDPGRQYNGTRWTWPPRA